MPRRRYVPLQEMGPVCLHFTSRSDRQGLHCLQAVSSGNAASAANAAAQAASMAVATAQASAKDYVASGGTVPAVAQTLVVPTTPAPVGSIEILNTPLAAPSLSPKLSPADLAVGAVPPVSIITTPSGTMPQLFIPGSSSLHASGIVWGGGLALAAACLPAVMRHQIQARACAHQCPVLGICLHLSPSRTPRPAHPEHGALLCRHHPGDCSGPSGHDPSGSGCHSPGPRFGASQGHHNAQLPHTHHPQPGAERHGPWCPADSQQRQPLQLWIQICPFAFPRPFLVPSQHQRARCVTSTQALSVCLPNPQRRRRQLWRPNTPTSKESSTTGLASPPSAPTTTSTLVRQPRACSCRGLPDDAESSGCRAEPCTLQDQQSCQAMLSCACERCAARNLSSMT